MNQQLDELPRLRDGANVQPFQTGSIRRYRQLTHDVEPVQSTQERGELWRSVLRCELGQPRQRALARPHLTDQSDACEFDLSDAESLRYSYRDDIAKPE